jgi:hypothetical protein
VPLGYLQIQGTFRGLVIHADQRNKITVLFKGAGLKEAERLLFSVLLNKFLSMTDQRGIVQLKGGRLHLAGGSRDFY